MNTQLKKGLLVFGGALLIYWVLTKVRPMGAVKSKKGSKKKSSETDSSKKNAIIILKAYSEAKKAGESKDFLDEMNTEFAKEFKMKVYTDKGTGKFFVADLEGNKVI